jgi:hypothetical protein
VPIECIVVVPFIVAKKIKRKNGKKEKLRKQKTLSLK